MGFQPVERGAAPQKRRDKARPLLPNDLVGPTFTLALWRQRGCDKAGPLLITRLAFGCGSAASGHSLPSRSPSISIRNPSFFLLKQLSSERVSEGIPILEKGKLAQSARVPLDYLGFILLTVRNKTKSPFPRKVCMSFILNLRLFPLPVRFLKEVINE